MNSIEKIVADCFFAAQPCLRQQVYYLLTQPEKYLEALETLSTTEILSTISQATKARVLVALCACQQYKTFVQELHKCDLVEISKACETSQTRPVRRGLRNLPTPTVEIVDKDNQAAKILATTDPPRLTSCSKYLAVRYHGFRSHLGMQKDGSGIIIKDVASALNQADFLIKVLALSDFTANFYSYRSYRRA